MHQRNPLNTCHLIYSLDEKPSSKRPFSLRIYNAVCVISFEEIVSVTISRENILRINIKKRKDSYLI
jgi:hypothetical protein